MNHISTPNSIAFWEFMELRVLAALEGKRAALARLLEPVMSSIDTMARDVATTAQRRQQVDVQLGELQRLRTLLYYLQSQLAAAKVGAGLPQLDLHISTITSYVEMLDSVLVTCADRSACEGELKHYQEQYDRQKSSGNTEAAIADRQRLRGYTVPLPVFGHDDAVNYASEAQRLRTQVDSLKIRRQQVLVSEMMVLQLTPDVAGLMAQFGMVMQVPAPAEEPAAPAQAAQEPAAPAPAEQDD